MTLLLNVISLLNVPCIIAMVHIDPNSNRATLDLVNVNFDQFFKIWQMKCSDRIICVELEYQ